MPNFRLQGLTAQSATFADPDNLKHELHQSVNNTKKTIGSTDMFLNRAHMKEIIPLQIVDGSTSKRVDQVVTVSFSGYSDEEALTAISTAWVRMKANVDAAIADGMLKGFRSDKVTFTAGE